MRLDGFGVMEPTAEPRGQRTCCMAAPEGNLIETGTFVEA